jgi:hypothetical protein
LHRVTVDQPESNHGKWTCYYENRTVQGEFKSIEVSTIDLIIEQSNKTEIIVTADDNLQKNITTTVKNGVLLYDYNSFINIESKKVTVKMPVIESLRF